MPCYRNNWRIVQKPKLCEGVGGKQWLRLPCGRCFGCRAERAKMWSIRCRDEASCWDHNIFLTLTYDDEHLPWHRSLEPARLQRFLKRLRRRVPGVQESPFGGAPVRFFAVGEYGERTQRPHYHLLLFNTRVDASQRMGKETYSSDVLGELWPYGSHVCGTVTPKSAAYVAGYAMKKLGGVKNYGVVVDASTGEEVERKCEFARMSNRPGIGRLWYEKFRADLRGGFVVRDGVKYRVPRYYMDRLAVDEPLTADSIKALRVQFGARVEASEKSDERLEVSETVAMSRHGHYHRGEQL